MDKFEHNLLLRIVKLLDAVLITVPFVACWMLCYVGRVSSPFYAKGSWLMIVLFFGVYIMFGRVYDAFLMSMSRILEIVYSQTLAALVTDGIMYIVIRLLSKHLPNLLPGLAAVAGQIFLAAVWAYNANHWHFLTFKPQPTAVIYDERVGMTKLIESYGLDKKHDVQIKEAAHNWCRRCFYVMRNENRFLQWCPQSRPQHHHQILHRSFR